MALVTEFTLYSATGLPPVGQRDANGIYFLRTAAGFKAHVVDLTGNFVEQEMDWSRITNKPTTLAGYGITDAQSVNITHGQKIFRRNFPNGVANQKVDITLPGAYLLMGEFVVTIHANYSNENGTGVLQKAFALGFNPGGAIFSSLESRYTKVLGEIKDKYAIGELTWDADNYMWKIPVHHLHPWGNPIMITVDYYSENVASVAGMNAAIDVSQVYVGAEYSGELPSVSLEKLNVNNLQCTDIAVNGKAVATLDQYGKVPASQLPSYVDDVLEYANTAAFPATGETGKIYVAIDTSKSYRWSGSAYVEIVASPGTTDNVPEGATNKYFSNARALSATAGAYAPVTHAHAISDVAGLDGGAYTPEISYSPAITDITADKFFFQRVGNIVSVTGTFQVVPDGSATSEWVKLSLPVPSDLDADSLKGTGFIYHPGTAYLSNIIADDDGDLIEVGIEFTSPGACQVNVSMMYEVK
ncbi:MAG: hypothetical protein JSS64_08480 [Bacteroidetes bacterium]|nr:hypothetical protein [Bacteroidota bacterium]